MKDVKVMYVVWLVLAAVCIAYGFFINAGKSGSSFFLIWILLAVAFAVFAMMSKFEIWGDLAASTRRFLIALAILIIAVVAVFFGLIFSKFNEKGEAGLDYVIVLGAQVKESGPSKVLQYRLDEAIAYLDENPDTICIVSGGQGTNEPWTEAEGMYGYLVQNGISEDRILKEDQSTNTSQNIEYSKELIEDGASVGIITNNFHMYRALKTAEEQALENTCGISVPSTVIYLPNNMLREVCAILLQPFKVLFN